MTLSFGRSEHLAHPVRTTRPPLDRILAGSFATRNHELYAGRLYYDRPIHASLEAFQAARRSTAAILEWITEAQWVRQDTRSESGRYSPEKWLEIYAQHAHTHADQIRKARTAAQ